MQTILIQVSDKNAMNELETMQSKKLIRIVKPNMGSYALPGKLINVSDLKQWIQESELAKTISVSEAAIRWEAKKKKLKALIR
jgi:hypothetical protein